LILAISIFSQLSHSHLGDAKNCDFFVHHLIIERYGLIHTIILIPLLRSQNDKIHMIYTSFKHGGCISEQILASHDKNIYAKVSFLAILLSKREKRA
jgi:hypothetical protein